MANSGPSRLLADDLYRMRWVLDPAISPDGETILYVLKDVNPDNREETYRYRLMSVDVGEDTAENDIGKELLPGFKGAVRAPKWSPDGSRIAFLGNIKGSAQLWVYELGSGQLVKLTDQPYGVGDHGWSPDGSAVAYTAGAYDESEEFYAEEPGKYKVIRRLHYKRNGPGYWRGVWSQVWVASVPQALEDVDEPVESTAVTTGQHNHASPCWSPDGSRLAFVTSAPDDEDRTSLKHVYMVELAYEDGAWQLNEPQRLTMGLAAGALSWSPDGEHIACIAHDDCEDRTTNTGVWVVEVSSSRVVNMTADIDRPAGDYITDDMNAEARSPRPRWSEDGKYLFSLMSERGRTWIVRIVFPGSEAYETGPTESHYNLDRKDTWSDTVFDVEPLLAQDYRCFAFDYDGSGTVVGTISAPEHPGDVFVLPDATGEPEEWRRLTRVNRELLAQRRLAEPLPVAFEGSEGRQIEGWLLLPTDDAEAPYPLVLHVHGAPHIAYSMAFNYELQHLASRGYAVLFLNPHGSHTYGRDIVEGTQHDWGGKDYNDLMLGVDHIIEREDIDENRLGVAGGSYGGWMTNFIVTRTSRFEGAVAQRSSANRISTMFSSEVGYRHQRWEAPGYPWEALDYFCKISPVLHAHKVDTPLLLVHAEHDHLCPLMQPEEMFTALKSLGREVELLVFLDEHHHLPRVGKPVNRIERLRQTAEWFDNYVM